MASHIGVQLGLPTVGVAKNLHLLAEEGEIFEKGDLYRQRLALLSKKVTIGKGGRSANKFRKLQKFADLNSLLDLRTFRKCMLILLTSIAYNA